MDNTSEITLTVDEIWAILDTIPDPEVPAISIVELGVIRKVRIGNGIVTVNITPTYSGCPATERFKQDIRDFLKIKGINNVQLIMQYSPAWTTNWLTDEAKEKLKEYGIAPPINGTEDKGFLFQSGPKVVPCVKCNSNNTEVTSQFGSTACKALYKCKDCLEPFEYFKCI
jgi:ring-1,2-phenylacetyl-CoA epoxidase subunit PaaD